MTEKLQADRDYRRLVVVPEPEIDSWLRVKNNPHVAIRFGNVCAAFGIVGLETMLPVSLGLVRDGVLTLPNLIAKMTCNPARLLNLNAGTLSEGAGADVCIFDPEATWRLDRNKLLSTSQNTPWHGREMIGRVMHTLKDGRIVFESGNSRVGMVPRKASKSSKID